MGSQWVQFCQMLFMDIFIKRTALIRPSFPGPDAGLWAKSCSKSTINTLDYHLRTLFYFRYGWLWTGKCLLSNVPLYFNVFQYCIAARKIHRNTKMQWKPTKLQIRSATKKSLHRRYFSENLKILLQNTRKN